MWSSNRFKQTQTHTQWCAFIWLADCFQSMCVCGICDIQVCVLVKWYIGQAALFVIGTGVGLNHLINNQLRLLNNRRFVAVAVKSIKFMQRSLCFSAMQCWWRNLYFVTKNIDVRLKNLKNYNLNKSGTKNLGGWNKFYFCDLFGRWN